MIRTSLVGESIIVLSVSYDDSSRCARWVRSAYRRLAAKKDPAILSVRPALDCLAIEFSGEPDTARLVQELESVEEAAASAQEKPPLLVPVCYAPEVAPDLPALAERTGLSPDEIAALHSSITYEVWMLGFMPGFPYLGKVPAPLAIPRKDRPTPRIPAGSVAVAEEYTGVYPFDSPGGWHIVGRTPLTVTDYDRNPPWLFDFGMKVRFCPMTIQEYRQSISAAKQS